MNRSASTFVAVVLAARAVAIAWRGRSDPGAGPSPAQAAAAPAAGSPKIALFNGKDLTGWVQYLPDGADPSKTWSVKDGAIHCTGEPAGYIRTEKNFKNYFLVVEWRW